MAERARWYIRMHNVGKPPEFFRIYDKGLARDAYFNTEVDACEAIRIIEMLRSDSAFLQAEPVKV